MTPAVPPPEAEAPRSVAALRRMAAWDAQAVVASARVRHPVATPFLLGVTYSGSGPVWFALAGVFLVLLASGFAGIPRLAELLGCMTGSFVSLVLGQVAKRAVRRTRPYHAIEAHDALGWRPRDHSMPSTHSSTAVALAVGLARLGHPLAPWVAPWAALVVLSRWYVGVHYPSDLAVGALLGVACGLVDWTWIVRLVVG